MKIYDNSNKLQTIILAFLYYFYTMCRLFIRFFALKNLSSVHQKHEETNCVHFYYHRDHSNWNIISLFDLCAYSCGGFLNGK